MRRFVMFGVAIVLVFGLISCSRAPSPADTEAFLSGLGSIGQTSMNSTAGKALMDLSSKNPPTGTKFKGVPSLNIKNIWNAGRYIEVSKGIEEVYGTWEYRNFEWVRVDSTYPENGILWRWPFLDSAGDAHTAEFLLDSLTFVYIDTDTIPTRIYASLDIDNEQVLWGSYHGTFNDNGNLTDGDARVDIVGIVQYGGEASDLVYNDPENPDEATSGNIHFWAIDHTQGDYRVDLYITFNEDESGNIRLTDSDGWEIDVDVSAPVEVVEDSVTYTRVDLTGEITKNGRHAADIEGTIWDPEDDDHESVIYVVFSDGSRRPIQDFMPEGVVTALIR